MLHSISSLIGVVLMAPAYFVLLFAEIYSSRMSEAVPIIKTR